MNSNSDLFMLKGVSPPGHFFTSLITQQRQQSWGLFSIHRIQGDVEIIVRNISHNILFFCFVWSNVQATGHFFTSLITQQWLQSWGLFCIDRIQGDVEIIVRNISHNIVFCLIWGSGPRLLLYLSDYSAVAAKLRLVSCSLSEIFPKKDNAYTVAAVLDSSSWYGHLWQPIFLTFKYS